jgi:hypothetical protein
MDPKVRDALDRKQLDLFGPPPEYAIEADGAPLLGKRRRITADRAMVAVALDVVTESRTRTRTRSSRPHSEGH